MTELLRYTGSGAPVNELEAWSDEAVAAAAIAARLAPTPFVPASLRVIDRGRPDVQATTANIAAALLTGRELGLSPMASLRSIDVVNGTPALRALALRALLQRAGHDVWLVESTKTRCIMRGRRAGSSYEQEVSWTIDRAKDLGLTGKPNWRQQPTAMLVARATAEIARLIAADAILGLPYIAEEVADDVVDADLSDAVEIVNRPPSRRTAQRARRPAAAPVTMIDPSVVTSDDDNPGFDEPSAQTPPQPEPAPDPEPPPDVTAAQLKALGAAFTGIGVKDRAQRLTIVADIVGRPVESSKDLYRAEAATVIDELNLRRARLAEADEDAALQAAYEADMDAKQQAAPIDDEPPL